MLITEPWSTIADSLGLVAAPPPPGSGADIALAGPDWPTTAYRTKIFPVAVRPTGVRGHAAAARERGLRLLVVVPSASPAVRHAALDENVSLLVVPPNGPVTGFLFSPTGRLDLTGAVAAPEPNRRPGRIPWATYAVGLELLATPGTSQRALAQRIGVTQPRVSQALRDLGDVVRRTSAGWEAVSPEELADWVLARYPWRPPLATSWLTLDPPTVAVRRTSGHLTERGVEHAVSGDAAADWIAPWARPSIAWIWAAAPADLQEINATPTSAAEANLFLTVPDDPHLLPSARRTESGVPSLPPWRVWIDLVHQGHDDAATALRDHLTSQGNLA